jgi:hypothetical protein
MKFRGSHITVEDLTLLENDTMSTGEGLLSSSSGPSSPKAEVMLYLTGRARTWVDIQQSKRRYIQEDLKLHITKVTNSGKDFCHCS